MTKVIRPISNTCILATQQKNKKIMIATDRRVSWDFGQAQTMSIPKLVKRDGVIMAGTGSAYLCDIILHSLDLSDRKDMSVYDFMNEFFYNRLKKLFIRKGFHDEHQRLVLPADVSVEVVLAIDHLLFSICVSNPEESNPYSNSASLQGLIDVVQLSLPYGTGCGGQWAWGAIEGLKDVKDLSLKEKVIIAMNVAAKYSPGCDNNIDIEIED